MELILLNEEQKDIYKDDILELMRISDSDFVPPMSQRFSPFQTELGPSDTVIEEGILRYYRSMMRETVLCAVEDGVLLGFVTYVEDIKYSSVINESDRPNIYICTLIVNPKARGRGITYRMYDYLFNEKFANSHLFTRTWSTNLAHISILKKYGFDEIHRIKDDRGEGIDTVYFGKRR